MTTSVASQGHSVRKDMTAIRPLLKVSPANSHWRDGLPTLVGTRATLRELEATDARRLHAVMSADEVTRFTWPPPPNVNAFQQFITWSHQARTAGTYICFAVVPAGECQACGVVELRQMQPGFFRAELGFAIDPHQWGTGVFSEAAHLALEFAFRVVKVHRIEARVAVENHRSNAALKKIGAVKEGMLREAFMANGKYAAQNLWAILSSSYDKSASQKSRPALATAEVCNEMSSAKRKPRSGRSRLRGRAG